MHTRNRKPLDHRWPPSKTYKRIDRTNTIEWFSLSLPFQHLLLYPPLLKVKWEKDAWSGGSTREYSLHRSYTIIHFYLDLAACIKEGRVQVVEEIVAREHPHSHDPNHLTRFPSLGVRSTLRVCLPGFFFLVLSCRIRRRLLEGKKEKKYNEQKSERDKVLFSLSLISFSSYAFVFPPPR